MMIIEKKVADESEKGMVGAQKWELSKYNLLNDDSIYRIILCMYSGPPILQ